MAPERCQHCQGAVLLTGTTLKQPRRDPLYLPEGDRSAQAGLEQPGGRKPDHIAHQLISKRKTEWQDPV